MLPPERDQAPTCSDSSWDPGSASSNTWLGCLLVERALAAGEVVWPGAANPQPSAEACCRSCRAFGQGGLRCNVWNYCGREDGCSMRTSFNSLVSLSSGQCE